MRLKRSTAVFGLGIAFIATGVASPLIPEPTTCKSHESGGQVECDPGVCDHDSVGCLPRFEGAAINTYGSYVACDCNNPLDRSGCCRLVFRYNLSTGQYDFPDKEGGCFAYWGCNNGNCTLSGQFGHPENPLTAGCVGSGGGG